MNKRFMNVIKIIFKDLHWKVLSLLLAVFLWFIGMNVNNPSENRAFVHPLQFSSEELLARDDIVLLNRRELAEAKISIGVRAAKSELELLNAAPNSVVASIDFRAVSIEQIKQSSAPVKVALDVRADLPPGYERMYTRPLTVDAVFDNYVRKPFALQIIRNGEVAEGHELRQTFADNASVTVSGAKSFVDMVDCVTVSVEVGGASESFERAARLVALDLHGNDVTSLIELSVRETTVRAVVFPYKQVPIEVLLTGSLETGYVASAPVVLPEHVYISAPFELLNDIRYVILELDLNSATEDVTHTFDISQALPQGAYLRLGEAAGVHVAVPVELVRQKSFDLPIGNVRNYGFSTGSYQIINTEPLRVTVRGPESAVTMMTLSQIDAQLNLVGLESGTHFVKLTFSLPFGISLVGDAPSIEVLVTDPIAADEEEEDFFEDEEEDDLFVVD